MVELELPMILQGFAVGAFLTSLCAVLGFMENLNKHKCQGLLKDNEGTFDIGSVKCIPCIKSFLKVHDPGRRNAIGLFFASVSATIYIFASIQAFENEVVPAYYLVTAMYCSLVSVAVAYDFRTKPDPIASDIPFSLGVICMITSYVAPYFDLYRLAMVMWFTGSYTTLIGLFLQYLTWAKTAAAPFELLEKLKRKFSKY